MEDKKRTLLAVIIACVVIVAMLFSFGLNLFAPRPQLILADPDASPSTDGDGEGDDNGGITVEVTPQTVQSVVASLARYESYSRTVTVNYHNGTDIVGTVSAQIRADGGWVRTDVVLPSGLTESSITGEGTLWLWYDGSGAVYSGPAEEMMADLLQRLPTYEDVLALDSGEITDAGYREKNGQSYIYVEAESRELNYTERFWVSESTGLLMAAETLKEGRVVYSMSSYEVVSPYGGDAFAFTLPDGTVLYHSEG